MFREIQIRAVLNGWLVQVGCQTVVYDDRSRLVTDLDQYLRDPAGTEERFLKAAVNAPHLGLAGAETGQAALLPGPLGQNMQAMATEATPREGLGHTMRR